MSAPTYEWVCQKCNSSNMAHTDTCAGCGFPAFFKVEQLPEPVVPPTEQNNIGDAFLMFFPEAIPAVLVVFCSPLWAVLMFSNGNALPALCLLGGVIACSAGFLYAYRRGRKWQAYASMYAVLVLAAMVYRAAT
jgi:hypothetical protein